MQYTPNIKQLNWALNDAIYTYYLCLLKESVLMLLNHLSNLKKTTCLTDTQSMMKQLKGVKAKLF